MSADAVSMCAYSAMKNIENFIAEYSVWNPVMSSDSASGMSNGNRLVSAKADTTNRMKPKDRGNANQKPNCCCCQTIPVSVTLPAIMSTTIRLKPRATS